MALGLAVCRVLPSLGLCALLPCSPLLHRGISRFHDSSSVTADVSLFAASFPPHLFIPVKFPPLSFSVYPSLFLSLSFPPNPTIGSMVLLIVARASHAHHSRSRTRGYRTNAIIHDRCTTRPFLSLSFSSSDFLSFNPGALGLCNFSPRGVIIRCRHRRHEKMRHGLYRRFGNTIPKKVEWNRSR